MSVNYAGMSTGELLQHGGTLFDTLERCARTRRRQDKASDSLTDLFLVVDALGQRLRLIDWNERVAVTEEEDDHEPEQRRDISLHELMSLAAEAQEPADTADDEDLVLALKQENRELRDKLTGLFRGVIRYTTHGCRSAEQVTKKWLALVRRVDPHALRDLGMSQTDVARALGERRATTSAREKREFEEPMKRAGARGWRGGTGGLRTEANRANCRQAQRGNRNRATGHAKQHAEDSESHLRPAGSGPQPKTTSKPNS